MDFAQLMQLLSANSGQTGGPGLADALTTSPAPQMSMPAVPLSGSFPGYDPTGSVVGGMNIPQSSSQNFPTLATEANINKLAMAPLDPAKLTALLGLGQGQSQQRGPMVNPGSPASGHGVQAVREPEMAVVKRPGALGGRG